MGSGTVRKVGKVFLALVVFSSIGCRFFKSLSISKGENTASVNQSFVRAEGTQLKIGGSSFAFTGSNFYRLALADAFGTRVQREYKDGRLTFPQIDKVMENYASEGIKVIRFWGFSCEGSRGSVVSPSLLKKDFGFDYQAWQQLDYTIASAGRHGLKVILPLVNFEHEYCGMEWWVETTAGAYREPSKEGFTRSCYDKNSHTLHKLAWSPEACQGLGEPVYTKELFFTNQKVWDKFAWYVSTILNRKNEFTGVALKDDPTIFAIEVANEPHTSDFYECMMTDIGNMTKDRCAQIGHQDYINRYKPGTIVYEWLKKASKLVKDIDRNHLVTSGEEGYRIKHDDSSCFWNHHWIHNGSKGVDFARNASIPTIDVMTTHLYPDNWGISAGELDWFNRCIIQDRAKIAFANNKPIILEESGFSEVAYSGKPDDYRQDRAYYISKMFAMSAQAGYVGTMVWQASPLTLNDQVAEDDTFTFPIKTKNGNYYQYSGEGRAVKLQIECMREVESWRKPPNTCVFYCPRGTSTDSQGRGRWPSGEACSY
jgi:mannan endo-1,4-beta-mannosidase